MNYFSHFIVLPDYNDPYLALGSIMPDLLRDARLDFRLHAPDQPKSKNNFFQGISRGIYYHFVTDASFHNSEFFKNYTSAISKSIRESQYISINKYTYFIAHILLELYIDHLLINKSERLLDQFYKQIEHTKTSILELFFQEYLPNHDFEVFLLKKDKFVQQKFLYDYKKFRNLGNLLSYILQKVSIKKLATKEKIEILNLVEQEYGKKIATDLPKVLIEMKASI